MYISQTHFRQMLSVGYILSPTKPIPSKWDLRSLVVSERSALFEKHKVNAKIIGAFRYGLLGDPNKQQWDRIPDMIRRLRAYQDDRNQEHLVDVVNLAELEFVEGSGVWNPQDDGIHTRAK